MALQIPACWQTSPAPGPAETHPETAAENPTWREERIANDLNLKLTIRVSLRTVGKYLRRDPGAHA